MWARKPHISPKNLWKEVLIQLEKECISGKPAIFFKTRACLLTMHFVPFHANLMLFGRLPAIFFLGHIRPFSIVLSHWAISGHFGPVLGRFSQYSPYSVIFAAKLAKVDKKCCWWLPKMVKIGPVIINNGHFGPFCTTLGYFAQFFTTVSNFFFWPEKWIAKKNAGNG